MYALKEGLGGIYMRLEQSKDGNGVNLCLEVGHNFSCSLYLPGVVAQSHPLPLSVTFGQYGASP